ncbi:MAG: hypothetical protein ACQESR_31005 [Planctomycetota bacterium]
MSKRKRKKRTRPERPLSLKWEFDSGIPTRECFEESEVDLSQAVENFMFMMKHGDFLAWEAVMAQEQELRLTHQQELALEQLINFNDPEDDQVLYIDEMPRPSEPWYAILNKIVPQLLVEPFRTFDMHYDEQCEWWGRLVHCLNKHADGLSLPEGIASPVEVVPAELRQKLWLQDCFSGLSGLGQDEELTLENEEERQFRIKDLVEGLREHKDSVRYFDLTLDSLLTRVIVPERDKPILIHSMQKELGIESTADRLANYL